MKILILVTMLLLNISCARDVRLKKEVENIKVNDFYTALAKGYNDLAQKEKRDFDWMDADYFAQKGLLAVKKQHIKFSNPVNYEIRDGLAFEELKIARQKSLSLVINNKTIIDYPIKTARLQILYDYWLEQLEEEWQKEDIARYRIEFWQSYQDLYELTELSRKNKIKRDRVLNKALYVVNFDYDESVIDYQAKEVLNNLIYYLTFKSNYKIYMEGHSDLSGNKEHNKYLSLNRVDAVKKYLINKGISNNVFSLIDAHGETKPSFHSERNKERINRRVEITIIKL